MQNEMCRLMGNENERGVLILVVEDVEETRDSIENLLKADGYRVDPARDEEDAVRRARRQHPDLILVSLGGPHVVVIATARRMRERAELNEAVPVVIFCMETVAEGAEVHIGNDIYITRRDNFDQLRRFAHCLLHRPLPTD